ncbi:hypothetical protein D8O04_01620 [Burkholderia mallei]|nr:hypothetical protein D8O04_01620 [Burkholderia mallei]
MPALARNDEIVTSRRAPAFRAPAFARRGEPGRLPAALRARAKRRDGGAAGKRSAGNARAGRQRRASAAARSRSTAMNARSFGGTCLRFA